MIAAWRHNVPPVPQTRPNDEPKLRNGPGGINGHPRIILACRSTVNIFLLNEIEAVDLSSFWTEDVVIYFRGGRRREYDFRVTGFSPEGFIQDRNHQKPVDAAVVKTFRESWMLDAVPERLVQPKWDLALGITYSLRRSDPSSSSSAQGFQRLLCAGKRRVDLYVYVYPPIPSTTNPLKRMRLEKEAAEGRRPTPEPVDCSAFFEPFRLNDTFDFTLN